MQHQNIYIATLLLALVCCAAICGAEEEADSSEVLDAALARQFGKRHMFLAKKRHLLIAKRRAAESLDGESADQHDDAVAN